VITRALATFEMADRLCDQSPSRTWSTPIPAGVARRGPVTRRRGRRARCAPAGAALSASADRPDSYPATESARSQFNACASATAVHALDEHSVGTRKDQAGREAIRGSGPGQKRKQRFDGRKSREKPWNPGRRSLSRARFGELGNLVNW
jgi:hypothetical protein